MKHLHLEPFKGGASHLYIADKRSKILHVSVDKFLKHRLKILILKAIEQDPNITYDKLEAETSLSRGTLKRIIQII